MIYGYIRVSTQNQNLDNQQIAINDYSVRNNLVIDKWVEEKKSGTIDYKKRNLGNLVDTLVKGDTLIVTELSRLGRSLSMIFNVINVLQEKGVSVIAIKNNFFLNPDRKDDITSQVLMFAFGLSAQIERQLISERTKQGLIRARQEGKHIGVRKGSKFYNTKLRPFQKEIIEKRKAGRSILSLANEYGVKWETMKRFLTIGIELKNTQNN